MPARNRIKTYVEQGYYHVYNRGVEKRKIFLDDQDYRVFLHLLKTYLSPLSPDQPSQKAGPFGFVKVRPSLSGLHEEVKLLAYCLLPNHFHLLLRQITKDGMKKFVGALSTTYVLYFNRKYERVGPLFQDRYKAAWVGEGDAGDRYLLHLSRYIHLNPKFELAGTNPVSWPYSSYQYYLGQKSARWVNPQPILNYFQRMNHTETNEVITRYQLFVEELKENVRETVGRLAIE